MEHNEFHNEENSYRTGSTHPPKKHGGLIAFLLIAVIFLGGIASAMGIWNVQMFRKLTQKEEAPPLAFSASDLETTSPEEETAPTRNSHSDTELCLNETPLSKDNVPQEGGMSLQQIYADTIQSVVSIRCVSDRYTSTGTGVVLTEDGYIVTNSHVVQNADKIEVLFTNNQVLPASVVGMDQVSDLAVLYVNAYNLTPAKFGDSSTLQVGDLAVAIGDPLGLELRGTMTDGIISAINRDITTGGRTMTLLQTNAALNSGNSGGPLLNCYGQVIGINTMKIGDYVNSGGVEGLGFAIPSTTVKEVVDQLIHQGFVSGRPYIGISGQEVSPLYQQLYKLPQGVLITEVIPDSPAQEVNLRVGDVLVNFDGEAIHTADELSALIYSHNAGDEVVLGISREGIYYEIILTIGQENKRE